LKSIEVSREAVDDFEKYIDNYFPNTVYGTKCRSWYKAGKEEGRVTGLWPGRFITDNQCRRNQCHIVISGSPIHAARALEYPRWEDFKYEQLDNVHNRFYWLGNGTTLADTDPKVDSESYLSTVDIVIIYSLLGAWYLNPENIDYPPSW